MRVTVQVETLETLKESVQSNCSEVRFGSEFCEWKIPSLENLKEAYRLVEDAKKNFSYVTPRISETNIDKVRRQLDFLDRKGETRLIFNDMGILNVLEKCPNLVPHLGRQLVFIPARCPWEQITNFEVGFMARRKVAKIFYRTSLNNSETIRFYRECGVRNVDLDWIPKCFPYFTSLKEAGFNISIHSFLTPVTSTRRCHTARFLGIINPMECPKPCVEKAFLLRNRALGLDFHLLGNTVFRYLEPSQKDMTKIHNLLGEFELVVPMNPVTRLEDRKALDQLMEDLKAVR